MTVVRDQFFFPQKPPGSRFRFSRTGVQPSPGSSTIELPSAFAESKHSMARGNQPTNQRLFFKGNGQKKWVYPPLFQTRVGGDKMQTSSPPVITPNRSQSNPDDMITLLRPIQSVGMDLHDVSGTSTGQTLPRERRAFVRQFDGYTHHLLLFLSSTHYCPLLHPLLSEIYPLVTTLRPSKGGLKRQSLLQTWCGSAPRRGPSANGYDAWRFGSCGPGRKILAAAAADLVWVCAPPRTIRKWLRRLAFWIRE